ncbi:unnamed protein product [Aspergillus oryzae]|nr:unnamed protein product [Aspergillus oryzae]GMF86957.1 unnamed protein product [Aspergillus oryzae]
MSENATTLLPWYLGYKGGDWNDAIQCMVAGSNGYEDNQASLNHDLNNNWARNNTPWSWGYLKRNDIPVQFAIAEGWTAGDMYQESQITSTNPNRVTLVSGSVNIPGSPQASDQGGPYIDNNETPGCDTDNINCYPLKWKTIFEIYEEAGVSWQVYQEKNNFDDNPLAWFQQYQNASASSPLAKKGLSYLGLDAFYKAAANGSLPEVSFIVGPAELSEHPPYMPKDGAWLQKKVVDAVTKSPNLPTLPDAEEPATLLGNYVGSSNCQASHPTQRPPVPYGQQSNVSDALWFEEGYKEVVGYLTEGRYLVFEKSGYALTNAGNATRISSSRTGSGYGDKKQRWVIHYSGGQQSGVFHISSALDGKWLGPKGTLLSSNQGSQAADVKITFVGNGQGYTLQYADSTPIEIDSKGALTLQRRETSEEGYKVWSVSYR